MNEERRAGTGPVAKTVLRPPPSPRIIGNYALFDQIGAGGMGVVYLGRVVGATDHERVVAIKRAHPSAARDAECIGMFHEEIRLHAHVRHQNVVAAVDMVEDRGELLLVMEYVHGQALGALMREARDYQEPIPLEICTAIACDMLHGLHAAHSAVGEHGEPLGIVHRDVSPQNILVGCDGAAHVLDFGLAKAETTVGQTSAGQVKGKLGYIAPEYLLGQGFDARADIYAASVVLWEMLACQRLFGAKRDAETMQDVLSGNVPRLPQNAGRRISPALEAIVRRGLAKDPAQRFGTALEMARAIEEAAHRASESELADWVTEAAHTKLVELSRQLAWAENCPIPSSAREQAEPETLIRPQLYAVDELVNEHTVRDAKFDQDELRGSYADLDHVLPAPKPPKPPSASEFAAPLTAPVSAPPVDIENRSAQTLPGRHTKMRRIDRARKAALCVAGLAAALSFANRQMNGALSERAQNLLHPERVAQASTTPAATTTSLAATSVAESATAAPVAPPAEAQGANEPPPTDRGSPPVVNLTSLPVEAGKPANSAAPLEKGAPKPRPPVVVASSRPSPAPAARGPVRVVPSSAKPAKSTHLRPDGF